MRIAMVGPFGFHPNKTMRSRAFSLARELVLRGHTVHLFMPPWQTPEQADKSWQEDGVEIRYTSLQGGVLGILRRLVGEIVAWKPDVVHCFKPKAYSGLVGGWLWLFHRQRIRLVMDTDDWEGWGGWNELASYSPFQKRFFAWQERWGLTHNHMLTVASRALETIALSMGTPPEQVVYVPNGPGIGQLEIGHKSIKDENQALIANLHSPVLLVYSRLFEFDTEQLVTILRQVKKAVPSLTILMVGAGLFAEDAAQFRRQVNEAGLSDAIVDAGWVEMAALPNLLAAADVGIYLMKDTLLNRTKCPVKLADMLLAGVPVVAEAVGQVPEYVVNGRSGRLRSSGDEASIITDLIELLQNPEERERLAAGAKAHLAANFSWSKLAEVVEQAYFLKRN